MIKLFLEKEKCFNIQYIINIAGLIIFLVLLIYDIMKLFNNDLYNRKTLSFIYFFKDCVKKISVKYKIPLERLYIKKFKNIFFEFFLKLKKIKIKKMASDVKVLRTL